MRILLLILLATQAYALDTSTEGFFPSWGGTGCGLGGGSAPCISSATPNQMRCWTLPARIGFSSITKMAGAILANGGASCVASWSIYSADGNTKLLTLTASCVSAGVKTATGLPATSLTQGTNYQLCTCASKASIQFQAIYEASDILKGKVATRNAGTTTQGVATNPCVLGVTPATTGGFASATNTSPAILRLEQ